jgi:hypothetical protein
MTVAKRAALAVLLGCVIGACDSRAANPGAPSPSSVNGTLTVTPSTLTLSIGEKAGLDIEVRNSNFSASFTAVTSSNPAVATVSPVSTGGGLPPIGLVTVTGVSPGLSTVHVTYTTTPALAATVVDIPVTVTGGNFSAYDGTYVGDATPQASSLGRLSVKPLANCPGAKAYGETIVVSVNGSGTGTLTMKDTKDFDRPYSGTISSGLTFSGQGTFSYLGTSVPGQLSVTFNSPTRLTFQETTTYGSGSGSCSNTYGGTLTKQ